MSGRKRILLVTHDQSHRRLISESFDNQGSEYELVSVGSLTSARDKLSETQFDLAIVDYLLPDGTGIDLLAKTAERETPAIVMTTFGDERTASLALQAGAVDYVTKTGLSLCDMPHIASRAITQWKLIHERNQTEQRNINLEKQIRHAQKLESIGVLAGGIAHDFNNLLTAIMGNAELALSDKSNSEFAQVSIAEIKKAAQRASELTNQMLAYSGRASFDIKPLNLNKLVQDMASLLQVSISKKIRLQYNFADDLPQIEGDCSQLHQIVMNLITNAAEAIDDKPGQITISTGQVDVTPDYLTKMSYMCEDIPAGRYVYLQVTDTGCGMDDNTRNNMFDPFFTTKVDGRGLGMSAVLGIVRAHLGALRIRSKKGHGTTFRVLLPAGGQYISTLKENHYNYQAEPFTQESGKVLIVDEEPAILKVISLILQQNGLEAVTAADTQQANEILGLDSSINAVILDLNMPCSHEEEALLALRANRPDLKVIISSGYNKQEVIDHFKQHQFDGFVQKPFHARELMETLTTALKYDPADSQAFVEH